jgi:hypothetical protein
LISAAEGFFDFYLNRLCAMNDARTDRGRLAVVKSLAEALGKTGSPVLLDTYAQKAALRLGVSADSVRAEFRKLARAVASGPTVEWEEAELPEAPKEETPPGGRELWLLRFLLSHDETVGWVAEHLDLKWIRHPSVRRVVAARLAAHQEGRWTGVPGLMDDLGEDADARGLITQSVAGAALKGDVQRNLVEAVRVLRNDFADRQLASSQVRLAEPGLEAGELAEVQAQRRDWQRLKQEPLPGPEGGPAGA